MFWHKNLYKIYSWENWISEQHLFSYLTILQRTYHVLGIILNILQILAHLIYHYNLMKHLLMGKLTHNEVNWLVQGHTVGKY